MIVREVIVKVRCEPHRMVHKSNTRQADCPGRLHDIKQAPHDTERFSLEGRRNVEKPSKCLVKAI